jgi:ubiquinone/menaquinone biosynthesis C-methylase UbiE
MASHVPGGRILDLGTGPGVSAIESARGVPGRTLIGLDRSAAMIARARRRVAAAGVDVVLVRADMASLPFADQSYDAVTGHSVLYLLARTDTVLREAHRVLRPNGAVAFLEPSAAGGRARWRAVWRSYLTGLRSGTSMALWSLFSALHGRYSSEALAAQLERCGFREARVSPTLGGLGLLAVAIRV